MIDDELRRYREEVRTLMEENRHLREAASRFGRLAERLNLQLQQERRRNAGGQLSSRALRPGKDPKRANPE